MILAHSGAEVGLCYRLQEESDQSTSAERKRSGGESCFNCEEAGPETATTVLGARSVVEAGGG